MFCVVETGGKQYKVSVGESFNVEKLDANVNDNVELKVLMLVDGEKVETGNPYLTKVAKEKTQELSEKMLEDISTIYHDQMTNVINAMQFLLTKGYSENKLEYQKNKEVTLDSNLKELGLDSLDVVDLLMEMEEQFEV